jgi:hypothetical protein
VELVIKLKAEGYLGDGLLHTINGREYVTREQLKKDIARSMDGVGGRIPLVIITASKLKPRLLYSSLVVNDSRQKTTRKLY